jgi:hypothetical protein
MGRIDHVVGSGGQSVPPRERCGAASLHSNNSIGLRSWVGAAVADYVVCGYVVDGLGVVLVDWLGVDRGREDKRGRNGGDVHHRKWGRGRHLQLRRC